MSAGTWIYLWSVLTGAVGFALFSWRNGPSTEADSVVFGVWLVLAIVAQLIEVQYGRQSYYPHFLTFFAGIVLLPPLSLTFLIVIPHLAEWIKKRFDTSSTLKAWYIQPFNIATHLISALAAQHAFFWTGGRTDSFTLQATLLAPIVAILVYIVINHLLIGQILVLARKLSWADSGIMDLGNIFAEATMMGIGYMSALVWALAPWLVIFALSPLGLILRALRVPQLEKEAQVDDKTGLWNSRYFDKRFAEELDRAERFGHPLGVIMADLDLLRDINNIYGHLAGDVVIGEIGSIIRHTIRATDTAGRFGGEEYAVVLPNADLDSTRTVAERLCAAVAATPFVVSTHPEPIHATMSLGVACYPHDGKSIDELVYEADMALYQAKHGGRNRVVSTDEVSNAVKLAFADSQLKKRNLAGQTMPDAEPTTLLADSGQPDVEMETLDDRQVSPEATSSSLQHITPGVKDGRESTSQTMGRAWLFVWSIIGIGFISILFGLAYDPHLELATIGLFALLALLTQWFQIELYEKSTVSISMALLFAAAIAGGIPGMMVASGVVALVHYVRVRPKFYTVLFNWSVHVIAGLAPVLFIHLPTDHFTGLYEFWWWLPTLAAIVLYYLCETGLVAAAISLWEGTSIRATWREQFRWLAGHYLMLGILGFFLAIAYATMGVLGLAVFSMPVFAMHLAQKEYVRHTETSVRELQHMNAELSRANQAITGAKRSIDQLNDELFVILAKVLDARDPYVSGHATQAGEYACAIAQALDLPAEQVAGIYQAGLLHDIGKIGIPERILHKPGKLTAEEYRQVQQHAALGAELLISSHGLQHLAPFVRYHHERWDGKGYPSGLKGEEIPLEARILAVCDTVDAMASDRPYRRAASLADIIAELKRCAGTQFDPMVVRAFIQLVENQQQVLVVNSALKVTRSHENGERRSQMADTWPRPVSSYGVVTGEWELAPDNTPCL